MRSKVSFNSDWYFYHGEKEQKPSDRDITDFKGVELPHDWSLDYPFSQEAACLGSGGYVETGIGYYKKFFLYAKEANEGMRTILRFDGAYMLTELWINGEFIGKHVYGYTPFEYDITNMLVNGDNLIFVKVDNSKQPNSRWYTGSGITRNTWLITVPTAHIDSYGIHAFTERVSESEWKMHVETRLVNPDNEILNTEYVLEGRDRIEFVRNEVVLTNPNLWSDRTPNLYKLTAKVYKNGELVDEDSIQVGIRETVFDEEQGFLCNGERIKLNGVCVHHDCGSVGAAVPKVMWERRLKKLKDMGCNSIRMSHNPPNPELLDLCDSMGFFVMDEAFDEWDIMKWKTLGSNTDNSKGYSEYFMECHEYDMTAMLLRDRNHPCIVLWSIGNEIPNQTDEKGHLVARQLKELVAKYDKTRPITVACDQIEAEPRKATEEFLNELDIVGYNYTGRWRKRAETYYDTDKRKHPEWKMIGTENTSFASVRGKYLTELENRAGWLTYPYFSAPVEVGRLLRFTLTRDYVAGDYMWTGFDYLGEAGWPHRSASSGIMDTCGFEKMGFYFYKSIWNRDIPMVHLEPHWNFKEYDGGIIQVLCFTNCEEAELFVNGKSYGRKAYSFPAYGMTEKYGHFDKTPIPASTDNLFLTWDVPYEEGELVVKGITDGKVIVEDRVRTAYEAKEIVARAYSDRVSLENDKVIQVEVSILDEAGTLCTYYEDEIEISVTNGKVIGCDSGNPLSHESMRNNRIKALSGKAFFVIRCEKTGICDIDINGGNINKKISVTVPE